MAGRHGKAQKATSRGERRHLGDARGPWRSLGMVDRAGGTQTQAMGVNLFVNSYAVSPCASLQTLRQWNSPLHSAPGCVAASWPVPASCFPACPSPAVPPHNPHSVSCANCCSIGVPHTTTQVMFVKGHEHRTQAQTCMFFFVPFDSDIMQ